MGEFHKVQVGDEIYSPIDWEMTPDLSFGTYESWGGRERVRNNDERVYYFFVDNWGETPRLRLMERGVKHAKILADIDAPRELVQQCVDKQGRSAIFERSYALDEQLKRWLIQNVLDGGDRRLVIPNHSDVKQEDMGPPLPKLGSRDQLTKPIVPRGPTFLCEDDVVERIRQHGFFESKINPGGSFSNVLYACHHDDVVYDGATGLMWMREGVDIGSLRMVERQLENLNSKKFADFDDWRLPSLEEAMTLMESEVNKKGMHLHPCFSKKQPFIFVDARRKPGGYWFVDYRQGRAFWSSGTIPGGFGRFVRSAG